MFCPSNNQDIVVDESGQPTRENPEDLSDTELDMLDEETDLLGNVHYVQDAFIFCPMMGTIQIDKILEQGIFFSEKEMGNCRDKKFSLYTSLLLLKIKTPSKVKHKQ